MSSGSSSDVRLASTFVAIALLLMILCLVRFTPVTFAIFLGPGLGCAALGFVLYFWRVVSDLRQRRII